MKALLLSLNTVLASLSPQPEFISQTKVTKVENPPIVGLWRLELEGKKDCTEDYNFKSNKKLSVVSGDEWTYGQYDIIYNEDKALPVLVLHTVFDDNNTDCSGVKRDQTGEQFAAFFKQKSSHEFELCASDAGKNCFMRFTKVQPY